ncbi:MAG: pyridoxal phosphate-dependent decarboxylase family protein, partial [Ignavibacteriales bacterium]
MRELLEKAAERSIRYLEGLDKRKVAPGNDEIARLAAFNIPFPDKPVNPETVLQQMDDFGSPATTAMAGRRYFGFVIGGSLPAALAANWLAAAWDQNSGLYNISPAACAIEQVALNWLLDVLVLPQECAGAFVTGTTVANFTALAAARHSVLAKAGWNVEADGLFGAPPVNVILGAEAHPTVFKSLGMLGLGRSRVVKVPVDRQGRIRPDSIPEIKGPTIVCLQAGNVNTGAIDPIRQ